MEKDDKQLEPEDDKKQDWAIPEMVKRAVVSGIGAVFMTEEGIRSYLSDLKLPKDAAQFILGQVAKTKEDVYRLVTEEIRSFLDNTQLDDVLRKVLTNISLEISTKVRFVDEAGALQPKAKASLKVSSNSRTKKKKKKKAAKRSASKK
jgi:hypothetical protein